MHTHTMAITLIMLSMGFIPYNMACAMVLGENIGTSITANIAASVGNTQAVYLTLDDVQNIYTADLSEPPHLAIQRDIFVFQCNIGCRIGDLLSLKKRDVINGAIEYIPTKTIKENARTVVVPLNSVTQEIVDRYSDYPGDKLLPFESSERFNDNIKIIFEKAGVTYLVP